MFQHVLREEREAGPLPLDIRAVFSSLAFGAFFRAHFELIPFVQRVPPFRHMVTISPSLNRGTRRPHFDPIPFDQPKYLPLHFDPIPFDQRHRPAEVGFGWKCAACSTGSVPESG